MTNDRYKIFVEQLRDGHSEALDESFAPEFLDVNERDLKFTDPVAIQGEAYLADDTLVLHVDLKTYATIPCSICNEPVKTPVEIQGFYHAVPIDDIKGGIYNFQEILRETILLETPALSECNQGKCPQRKALEQYLKKESSEGKGGQAEEGYRPFADFDFDEKKKKLKD